MKGILVTSENKASIMDFAGLHAVDEAVGGYSELVRPAGLMPPMVMFVNEEGRIRNLPYNLIGSLLYGHALSGEPIVGDIVILNEERDTCETDGIYGFTDKEADNVLWQINNLLERIAGGANG